MQKLPYILGNGKTNLSLKMNKVMVVAKKIINLHFLAGVLLIAMAISSLTLKGNNQKTNLGYNATTLNEEYQTVNNDPSPHECNLFSGRWVYDNTSTPPYKDTKCSFMFEEYACEKYGRKDLEHQKWRWQPHHCNLPRFNGTAFMEKIRGKKLYFVGDSLNKNQWSSMLCLLESSLNPSSPKYFITDENLLYFQATEYNATIGFYWSPLLVESNNDDLVKHHATDIVVRIEAIEKHAIHWTDADILVFDSYAWWTWTSNITVLLGSENSSDAIYSTIEAKHRLYEMALNTWSDWLEFHIDPTKTKLFFMSQSPLHLKGEDWSIELHCYNQTDPILKDGYWGIETDKEMMRIVKLVLKNLESKGVKVEYLNITQLSEYRKDGHPSIYKKFYQPLTEGQLRNPKSYADCGHWCLPGVPDVWNQILYSYIMND